MARHQVQQDPKAAPIRLGHQAVERGQVTEDRVDVGVVADVVAEVGQWRWVDRAHPDGVDAQRGRLAAQVVEVLDDAGEVADAVAAGVGEGARIDLVDDPAAPPVAHGRTPATAGSAGRQTMSSRRSSDEKRALGMAAAGRANVVPRASGRERVGPWSVPSPPMTTPTANDGTIGSGTSRPVISTRSARK